MNTIHIRINLYEHVKDQNIRDYVTDGDSCKLFLSVMNVTNIDINHYGHWFYMSITAKRIAANHFCSCGHNQYGNKPLWTIVVHVWYCNGDNWKYFLQLWTQPIWHKLLWTLTLVVYITVMGITIHICSCGHNRYGLI